MKTMRVLAALLVIVIFSISGINVYAASSNVVTKDGVKVQIRIPINRMKV